MKLTHTLREATKVFDVKGIPQYKVAQNPSDKKWYVLGVTRKTNCRSIRPRKR